MGLELRGAEIAELLPHSIVSAAIRTRAAQDSERGGLRVPGMPSMEGPWAGHQGPKFPEGKGEFEFAHGDHEPWRFFTTEARRHGG